VLNFVKNNIS